MSNDQEDDSTGYAMSAAGMALMAQVLTKAGKIVDLKQITKHNLTDFIQTFADNDSLWEGTDLTDLNERKVMMFFALESMVLNKNYKLPSKNEYN